MSDTNPLLIPSELPRFSHIKLEDIEPAIKSLIDSGLSQLEDLLSTTAVPSWQTIVEPIDEMANRLEQLWSPISHLNAVKNSDALRDVYNACLALLTDYQTTLGQHRGLFEAYSKIAAAPDFATYNQAQRKVIENELRDFRLSGIDLDDTSKLRMASIKKRLAEISNTFSNNVLDATQGWTRHITDESELAGLPAMALAAAGKAAQANGQEGYLITLDIPSYQPLMMYCDNAELRRELYEAYTTRASDQGPCAGQWDNSALMQEILGLRHELATILGFNNYAELSLATKMARSPDDVINFLEDLAIKSRAMARAEFAELEAFAGEEFDWGKLEAWDVAYFGEKLREKKYAISQETLRAYFPAAKVIQGMFDVVAKLYGLEIREIKGVDLYHEDVHFFEIYENGSCIAKFYLDLYARENKRGGAWMADCRMRHRKNDGSMQLPVAFLTCNFSAPTQTAPSLLTHTEVVTLFHEFGHGLHHMLTQIDVMGVSGINGVEWDAVELPSQFMENWCWEKEAIEMISGHYESGECLPQNLLDKLIAAKNFQAAMQMTRQLEFSLFDFKLHMAAPDCDIQTLLDEVREQVSVIDTPAFNRFQHGFSHIFSGGYAAGYYSYKWAEVLSADAFSLFEEEGIFDQRAGERFKSKVLQKGGSEDAMQLFVDFRGREPSVDALLRHNGINQ